MWPFGKKIESLQESGMFKGFIDWHSHILPGVDDGIKTMEESLSVLQAYEKLGFKKVWLTPHIMEDYPNATQELRQIFNKLKDNWSGDVDICLAAENMLDSLFESRLEDKDVLPIGDEGLHLLVETSYYTPPFGMYETLDKIKQSGYFPILAHPERYRYMDEKDYKCLKASGILFQMNFSSLVGGYGETARKKAEWLLSQGMINILGTDVHRLEGVLPWMTQSPKRRRLLDSIFQVASNPLLK